MSDIVILTADKLGKGNTINPITKLLDIDISNDDGNSIAFGSDNGLFIPLLDNDDIDFVALIQTIDDINGPPIDPGTVDFVDIINSVDDGYYSLPED